MTSEIVPLYVHCYSHYKATRCISAHRRAGRGYALPWVTAIVMTSGTALLLRFPSGIVYLLALCKEA